MSWKKIKLSRDEIAAGKMGKLQDAYLARFMAAGFPQDAFMYANLDSAAEGHQIMFSPTAVKIAGPLLAPYTLEDCPEPVPGNFAVLVSSKTKGGGG